MDFLIQSSNRRRQRLGCLVSSYSLFLIRLVSNAGFAVSSESPGKCIPLLLIVTTCSALSSSVWSRASISSLGRMYFAWKCIHAGIEELAFQENVLHLKVKPNLKIITLIWTNYYLCLLFPGSIQFPKLNYNGKRHVYVIPIYIQIFS